MNNQNFFKGLGWLVLLNLLVKPIWIFGIDRQLQNIVGHENYGSYFSVLNLSIVFSFLADAGLTNMMNRNLAAGEQLDLRKVLSIKLFLSLIYTIVILIIAALSGIELWNLLFLVIGIQVITSFLIFFRNIITAHQKFRTDAWISVTDKVVMILIFFPLFYMPFMDVEVDLIFFLSIQLSVTTIALIVAAVVARKYIRNSFLSSRTSKLLKEAFPFTAIIFLMSVHTRLDGFLLERIHVNGAMEAGIYASAFRLLDAGNMVGYLAASFLVPFVAHHLNRKAVVEQTVLRLRHLLMVPAITIMIVIVTFPDWVYSLLYYNSTEYSSRVLSLSIIVLPAYYLIHIYGSVMTARGLLRQFILIVFIAAIINTVLNLFLIPVYGAIGSCIAALVSQYLCALLVFIFCSRYEKIRFHLKSVAGYIITGILMFALFYVSETAGLEEIIAISIGCFAAAMIMFVQYNRVKNLVPEPNN